MTGINLGASYVNDWYGENWVSHEASFSTTSGSGTIADVWFETDTLRSINRYGEQPLQYDVAVWLLPDLKGYGVLPDLRAAMQERAAQAFENDADLFLGREVPPGGPPDEGLDRLDDARDGPVPRVRGGGWEAVAPAERGVERDCASLGRLAQRDAFDERLGVGEPHIAAIELRKRRARQRVGGLAAVSAAVAREAVLRGPLADRLRATELAARIGLETSIDLVDRPGVR